MRDIKISSNYTLLLIIILSVSIGFAIYFATKNSPENREGSDKIMTNIDIFQGTINSVNSNKNFKVTYFNDVDSILQYRHQKDLEIAINFWKDKFLEEELRSVQIDVMPLFSEDIYLLGAAVKKGTDIDSGCHLYINLNGKATSWDEVIKHEIAHCLGVGTDETWINAVIVSGESYYLDKNIFPDSYNFYKNNYPNPSNLGIPLGEEGHHFNESIFKRELMTPFLNDGGPQPTSKLTLTVLDRIGWKIDHSKSELL